VLPRLAPEPPRDDAGRGETAGERTMIAAYEE
jgi:hypothetical protein